MIGNRIQIDELRLGIVPLTTAQARRLGEELAKCLAQMTLSFGGGRRLSNLTIRFGAESLSSIERMAEQIATKIQHGLD